MRSSFYLISTFPASSSPAIANIAASLGPAVNLEHSIYRGAHTEPASSYIIRSRQTGSRTIVNYNGLPEMTAAEFVEAVTHISSDISRRFGSGSGMTKDNLRNGACYWFHFEGRIPAVTLSCIRHLRTAYPGVHISVEMEKPDREGLEDLAREADVVFYSRSWAAAKGYADAEACVRNQARATKA